MNSISDILQLASQFDRELPALPADNGRSALPINRAIDSAVHRPEADAAFIEAWCREAIEYHFAGVYTNPVFLPLVAGLLKGTGVAVGSVAGFPLGGALTRTKVYEAEVHAKIGASEIDMVISIAMLKSGEYATVLEDIRAVAEAVHEHSAIVKVILETALLTRREKILACLLSEAGGADFVKTSTGFGPAGATLEDIDLMRRVVGNEMRVKASGGIHSLEFALALINAGADRLGTTKGVTIVEEFARLEKEQK